MSEEIVCWKCGAELKGLMFPFSRREECPACAADQHVCKLCRYYDVTVAGQCREDRAEEVTDKERANFCDYFEPDSGAYQAQASGGDKARAQLAELFGEQKPDSGAADLSPEEQARAELNRLFGDGDEE